jgi:hypothetical protein
VRMPQLNVKSLARFDPFRQCERHTAHAQIEDRPSQQCRPERPLAIGNLVGSGECRQNGNQATPRPAGVAPPFLTTAGEFGSG